MKPNLAQVGCTLFDEDLLRRSVLEVTATNSRHVLFVTIFKAADITGGLYLKVPRTLALLQYLLVSNISEEIFISFQIITAKSNIFNENKVSFHLLFFSGYFCQNQLFVSSWFFPHPCTLTTEPHASATDNLWI